MSPLALVHTLFGQEMKLPEADDLALKPEVDDDTQIKLDHLVEKLDKLGK